MTTQVSPRPNILLILTDQFRADCISALGHQEIRTPNLDRLVREGTSFQQCYTPSPVCVPARHGLASGLAPHVTGCVDNVNVDRQDPSYIERLAEAGYQTHGIGKMHFIKSCGDWGFETRDTSEEVGLDKATDDYKRFLAEQGYEHVYDPHGIRSENYYLPQPSQLPTHLHNSHWVVDKSIDFLAQRDETKPFFLCTSFIKPHPPFETPNPWGRLYRMHETEPPFLPENSEENWTFWNRIQNRYKYVEGWAENRNLSRMIKAAYYSTISFIDYNIGRLFETLGDEMDNTVIIFTADHGELLGDFGCYGKRSMLDPSARIPMLARHPGTFEAGVRCGCATTLLDLFPTFTALAGKPSKPENGEGIPLQESAECKSGGRIVFSQYSQGPIGLYMACDGVWKYIYSAADNKEWLFNLQNDPRETKNLACNPEFSSEVDRLKLACIERFTRDGYTLPVDNGTWKRFDPVSPPIPESDDGLLFQDPPELDAALASLGEYARSGELKDNDMYRLFDRLRELST